jgi:hypothetical protein
MEWTKIDTLKKLKQAHNSLNSYKNREEENKWPQCLGTVGISYYEVSQTWKIPVQHTQLQTRVERGPVKPRISPNRLLEH